MKIAILAPLEESVPPHTYGGTERVVYNLAEELVKLGHDVTLFASGDSTTAAKLVKVIPKSIRDLIEINPRTWFSEQIQYLHHILEYFKTANFDIVHNHIDVPFLLVKDLVKFPIVTTLHNPFEYTLSNDYHSENFVSISKSQRKSAPQLHYISTVYHGIDVDTFEYNDKPESYLAYLGRINPDKGPLEAIKIAKKTRRKLMIAAKVDAPDRTYYREIIKPLIDGKQIVFLGEVREKEKINFLKNAKALLSPIQWDEPFGLTNIEAMACGTPVIAINRGSLPEIIVDKVTGYLCKDIDEMVERVYDLKNIARMNCRIHVEKKFNAKKMAQNYLNVYSRIINA